MFGKLTQETLAMMGRLGTITQDTLNRVRNLGPGHENFIPIDLRNRLDADADQADRNGDRACAAILRQMAAYTGTNAPQQARDLGVSACTNRYAAARELMQPGRGRGGRTEAATPAALMGRLRELSAL